MQKIIKLIFFGIFITISSHVVFADELSKLCQKTGYTVSAINGIFTDEEGARHNQRLLKVELGEIYNGEKIDYQYLLNPSHLGGLGDLAKVVYQKIFEDETVLDYDLVEMLKSASDKVKTQKLLLVAHSQGNFYANSFYDTVAEKEGGVPKESIGVYAVATPAGRVAGGGQWLTSDTDKIIAELVGSVPFKKIMPPNTSIALAEGDDPNGHNFSGAYLKRRSQEIVSGIKFSLDKLQTNNVQRDIPCMAPPKLTLAHKATGAVFSAVDPAANASKDAVVFVAVAGYQASKALAKGAYSLTGLLASAGSSLLPADDKPLIKTYSLWVGSEENQDAGHSVSSISNTDKPAYLADKFKQAEESLQVLQSQLLALENQLPSRTPLDGRVLSEPTDVQESRFAAAISPGFGGGGTGVAESSSSASLPADEWGSSSSSSSASSADSSSSSSESSSSSRSSSAPDTAPPAISSFSIAECQQSLSSDGCLVATTTLHISWNSTDADLAYFIYNQNGTYGTTTATSTGVVAPDNAVFSFAVSARDSAGNYSATSTQTAEISTMPVVINEVAWAGNSAGYSADEWIELYNRTSQSVNLSDWVLYSKTDLSPYASLSGTISSRGYYLLERTNDDTVSNLTADKIYTGDLVNNGENLALVYRPYGQATTTIDEIPYDYNWYAGSDVNYLTMERYSPDIAGTNAFNWGTNNSVIFNGKNAGRSNINGTPKARNSANYLVNRGQNVSANLTLSASGSPYLVDNTLQTFSASSTLIIEPGVTIKFYNSAGWQFTTGAKILAQGTAVNPIIFTSFYDDTYGGDTNGDSAATSPSYGNWFGLRINSPGAESMISGAIFRYGGKAWSDSLANLYIANSSASVSNSVFEYGKAYGVRLSSASSTFSNNIFRNNNNSDEGGSTGLYSEFGTPTLSSNVFSNNKRGLYILGASSTSINSNTFTANTNEAVYSYGRLSSFFNNSGSGNGIDAISLNGTITQNGATTTLLANSLPYLLNGNVIVVASSTLSVNPGSTIRGWSTGSTSYLDVYGNLVVSGVNFSDIVFGALSASPSKGIWGGLRLYSGSYSTISGATFEYANTAISYAGSPINLTNVKFNENNLGVSADTASRAYPINASGITFTNNTATTSPGGLW